MYWNLLSVFANCLWIYFVSNMGHFIIKFWAGTSEKHVCVFSKCLAKLCLSTPKNEKHVGNSDRNETCQCAERMCVLINYMWDDIVLNGLLIGKTIAYRFIAGNVNVAEKMPWKSLKLVRCAFSMRLWMFFLPWTVLKMWSPKHSLFLCCLNGYRAPHAYNFRRPPTAHRPLRLRPPEATTADGFPWKKRLRHDAAALRGPHRPRRGCGAVAEQRRRGGRQGRRGPGPQSGEAGARHRVSSTRAPQKAFPGLKLLHFSANVWQSCEFSAQKNAKHVGNNDHNVICQ